MAISHTKKIIFVHIAKTGGTSIVRNPSYDFKIDGHTSILFYKEKHPDLIGNYTSMCLVRNPWDRFVSAYEYVRMENSYYHNDKNIHPDYPIIKHLTFEEVVEGYTCGELSLGGHVWAPQFPRIKNEFGIQEIDYVFRTEQMNTDKKLREFFPEIEHLNKSNRRFSNYREYYSEKTKRLIADFYAEDITKFNYSFE
jgi:hypothetical protein